MGKLKALKRPKVFTPVIIALLLIAAIVSAIRNLNSPAQGTVTTQLQDTNQPAQAADTGNQTYKDAVITFDYPSRFMDNHAQKEPGYLDTVALISKSPRDEFISIGVYKGDIASDSGVNYRHSKPDLYKLVSSTPNQILYAKLDGTEYTGFLQRGANEITISFTSVGRQDSSAYFQTIAGSIKIL